MYGTCAGWPGCRAPPTTGSLPMWMRKALTHELQDAIQHICLKHRYYGYRRVTAALRRPGHVINAKRVPRLMRDDNLLAMRRKPFLVPPSGQPESLVIVPQPDPCPGALGIRPDLGGRHHLCAPGPRLRLSRGDPRCLLAQGRGLGAGAKSASLPGGHRTDAGPRHAKARQRQPHPSFRPRRAIRQPPLPPDSGNPVHGGWLLCGINQRTQHGTSNAASGRRPPHRRKSVNPRTWLSGADPSRATETRRIARRGPNAGRILRPPP